MEWIRTADVQNSYDVISAFEELEMIDWTKKYKISNGDIVYLYVGRPYQKIMYKYLVVEDNIKLSEMIDDKKYFIKNSKSNMTKGSDIDYIRLKKLMHINDERLSIHELRNKKLVN